MSISLLKDLVSMANILDEAGFTKVAAEMDDIIQQKRKELEEQSKIHELGFTAPTVNKGETDFLKKMFASAVADPSKPGITEVVLKDIYTVLDEAAIQSNRQINEPRDMQNLFVTPMAVQLGESLAELEVALAQMQQEIQDPNLSDLDRSNLQRDIEKYQESIQSNRGVLEQLRTEAPQDYEKVVRYIEEKKKNPTSPIRLRPDLRKQQDRRHSGE